MKKRMIITFGMFFCVAFAFAQVGINEQYPKATFDIEAKTNGTDSEGLLIPRLTANQVMLMTNKISLGNYIIGEDQNSLLIYITEAFTTKLGGKFEYIDSPGYYYFLYDKNRATDSRWIKLLNTSDRPTGLEKITEGGKTGWRLIGRNPRNYGSIGSQAVDLSYNNSTSDTKGATGDYSTAIGYETKASGNGSIATGFKTQALGEYSLAMGVNSIASGRASFAMGINATTSGRESLAIGSRANAAGHYSTAIGWEIKALGEKSTAMGASTHALGEQSTAMGWDTKASGNTSTAIGWGTKALGDKSTAMGQATTASGTTSVAMGRETTALGNYSTAMGYETNASGVASTAMGSSTSASEYTSTAMGFNTEASGYASVAMGYWTRAPYSYSIAMGSYNATPTNALLMVGNGGVTPSAGAIYRNALTVYKDGTIEAKAIADTNGGSSTDKVVVVDTDGKLKSIQRSAIAGNSENIYTTNGTITGKRTVTLANESSDITLTKLGTNNKNPLLIINGTAKMMAADMNSDARLKQNITSLSSKNINDLRAVSYFWNTDGKKRGGNDKLQYGFIAQEVEKVYPNLVSTDKDGYKSVNYMQVIPILTRAIQEERQINQEQQIQLDEQAKEIARLKELIEGLIK